MQKVLKYLYRYYYDTCIVLIFISLKKKLESHLFASPFFRPLPIAMDPGPVRKPIISKVNGRQISFLIKIVKIVQWSRTQDFNT